MKGWKTWAAGLALILPGVGLILGTVASGEFDLGVFKEAFDLIGSGLAALGIGHKIEKAAGA